MLRRTSTEQRATRIQHAHVKTSLVIILKDKHALFETSFVFIYLFFVYPHEIDFAATGLPAFNKAFTRTKNNNLITSTYNQDYLPGNVSFDIDPMLTEEI